VAHQTISRDGVTVHIHRYGFLRPGFYAEAVDAAGKRLALTGVFAGKGSKKRAVDAALAEAKTGRPAPGDTGPAW
jgi:hypothetical protein